MGDDPNHRGLSRRWIMQEVENSLRRLGTDWIDVYQVHRPEPDTDTNVNPADGGWQSPALQLAARRR
jgi:aryl-alcohol dehydrogenase-like predicted oxidoreductase